MMTLFIYFLIKVISKWNISCLDNLPDYMQFLYKIVLDFYEEIVQKMTSDGRVYALNYYVKEVNSLLCV
jgi:hypothetical protein